MTAAVLETRGLCKNFGFIQVAAGIDFQLMPGARHALIGPNGAGKTSFVNLLTGALRPSAGSVLLNGADVTRLAQGRRARLGIARTFQINQLFRGLSVLENVCLAVAERSGACNGLWRPMGAQRAVIAEALGLLETLKLDDIAARPVRELPYGRQRLVEIAIALGQQPKVLLLDEPAAGVPSAETHIILDVIERLPSDIALLIIEHDMAVVFRIAQEITVLVAGSVLAHGAPEAIAADPRVRAVYLGKSARE
jgi:branched-chain amino acid transport system ATP-binding protein